jgi:hypothetical protein
MTLLLKKLKKFPSSENMNLNVSKFGLKKNLGGIENIPASVFTDDMTIQTIGRSAQINASVTIV